MAVNSVNGQTGDVVLPIVEGVGTDKLTVSDTEPVSPSLGDVWIDSDAEFGDLAFRDNIEPDDLNLGTSTDFIVTAETTTSATYTNLATHGPEVTVSVPASGIVLVFMSVRMEINSSVNTALMAVELSGANTLAAHADNGCQLRPMIVNGQATVGTHVLFTGLTPGSTTFTLKYSVTGSTGTYARRRLTVLPWG